MYCIANTIINNMNNPPIIKHSIVFFKMKLITPIKIAVIVTPIINVAIAFDILFLKQLKIINANILYNIFIVRYFFSLLFFF